MTTKPLTKILPLLLSFAVLLILSACGGAETHSKQVTVTFAMDGSPAIVGSVDLEVVLPDSFILELESGSIDEPSVDALVLLTERTVLNDFSYVPATAETSGVIYASFGAIDGFSGTDNLMQISRIYAPREVLPTAADFSITVIAGNVDNTITDLPGITPKIIIDIQPVL